MSTKSSIELRLVDNNHKIVNKKYINDLLYNCSDEPAIQIAYRIAEAKKDGIMHDEVRSEERRVGKECRL